MDKEIVKDVVEEICNMLYVSVVEENGIEDFENWCEDGEVFEDVDPKEAMKVAKRLSPFVDVLSAEIEKVLEGE